MKKSRSDWNIIKDIKIKIWPFKGRSLNDLNLYLIKKSIKSYLRVNYKWLLAIIIPSFFSLVTLISSRIPKQVETIQYTFIPPISLATTKNLSNVSCKESYTAKRNDALRCSTDDSFSSVSLRDPCFTSENLSKLVICPNSPYDEFTIFEVSKIEKEIIYNQDLISPWYIILEDGTECEAGYGGTRAIADSAYDYDCKNGKYVYLVSPIDKNKSYWKIRCLKNNDKRLEYCNIKEVWF